MFGCITFKLNKVSVGVNRNENLSFPFFCSGCGVGNGGCDGGGGGCGVCGGCPPGGRGGILYFVFCILTLPNTRSIMKV